MNKIQELRDVQEKLHKLRLKRTKTERDWQTIDRLNLKQEELYQDETVQAYIEGRIERGEL
jgi:hypothetical protein